MIRLPARLVTAVALCVGASLVSPAPPALAQPKGAPKVDEARSRYERGRQLYDEGAFDAALIEFQRAHELAPSYKILFNIGQVHRQRNDYANALRAYEQYLKEGAAEIDAKRRADVEREISQLRGRVATLQIVTNVAGAEISIDDEPVGKTPLPQGVLVNSGKRKVTASKEGRAPVSKVINVAGAENRKIEIELAESSGPGTAPTAPATAPTGPATAPPPATTAAPTGSAVTLTPEKAATPWVAWALTGALAVGAGVTGVLALNASSDLKDKRSRPDPSPGDLDDLSGRAKTMALVSDLLWVGTAVAGGVSIYLTLREPSKEPSAAARGPVRLGVGPGSLRLDMRF